MSAENYRDLIFTTHAHERRSDRIISPDAIYQTIHHPAKSWRLENNKQKYIATVGGRRIQVVAKYLKDENRYLVISTWVRGENDRAPFIWQLITLPIKILWWLIRQILSFLKK